MTDIDPRDAHMYRLPTLAPLVALIVMAAVGVVLFLVFFMWSGAEAASYSPDASLLRALGILGDAALTLGVVATVGALVLGGVRALHASPELSRLKRR